MRVFQNNTIFYYFDNILILNFEQFLSKFEKLFLAFENLE